LVCLHLDAPYKRYGVMLRLDENPKVDTNAQGRSKTNLLVPWPATDLADPKAFHGSSNVSRTSPTVNGIRPSVDKPWRPIGEGWTHEPHPTDPFRGIGVSRG
jgi:hypothetical protein